MAMKFWKEKTGPLPNWAWAGMGLGGAVAYSSWARNRAAAKSEEATSSAAGIELPGDVAPTYVFQDADTTNITFPGAPAGGGRPPVPTLPWPATPKPAPRPTTPTPAPKPVPKPPAAPKGKWVTVAKWNATKAPWNSTLWGITQRLLGPKAQWQSVWSAPQNKAVRDKRKDPTKIQAGDKIWVPGAK